MIRIALSAAVSLLYASVLEWLVHRFGYHDEATWTRATRAHDRHHDVLYPCRGPLRGPSTARLRSASRPTPFTSRSFFERSGRYETSQPFWLEAAYVAAHAPIFALVWLASPTIAATFAIVLAAYAALAHYVHPATHLRTGAWYERTRLFKRLVARHVRHHQDTTIHFNVLLPFGDWLFGTGGTFSHQRRGRVRRSDLDPA